MNAVVENQPVHWVRGGSGSDRIVACPGCVNEQQKWPEDPSGAAAIDGTHSHTLLETCLRNNAWKAQIYIGTTLEDHEGAFVVDKERCNRVQVALDYVRERLSSMPGATLEIEKFVDAGSRFGIPHWGGSADIVLSYICDLEVIDYKDGGKAVSPESFQPVTYTIGRMNDEPGRVFHKIINTIIQPKRSKVPLSIEYTKEEFAPKMETLVDAMRKSMDPNAPRIPGEHCKYCRGAKPGRCKEFNERVVTMANAAFNTVPVPGGPGTPAGLSIPKIDENMTDEQLKEILDAAPVVREFLKEAEAEGLKRARAGHAPPNYKVVRGQTQRRWKLKGEELAKKLKAMRLPKETYIEEKVRTPKQVAECDAVKEWTERKRKNLMDLIEKPEGALKLVPETDPGTPVTFGITQDKMAELEHTSVPSPTTQPAPGGQVAPPSFL